MRLVTSFGCYSAILKQYEFNKENTSELQDSISLAINKRLVNQFQEKALVKQQINELTKKLEKLEMRFVEAEINNELFDKYSDSYKAQMTSLKEKSDIVNVSSSNLGR